jgi:hypothetical protein
MAAWGWARRARGRKGVEAGEEGGGRKRELAKARHDGPRERREEHPPEGPPPKPVAVAAAAQARGRSAGAAVLLSVPPLPSPISGFSPPPLRFVRAPERFYRFVVVVVVERSMAAAR